MSSELFLGGVTLLCSGITPDGLGESLSSVGIKPGPTAFNASDLSMYYLSGSPYKGLLFLYDKLGLMMLGLSVKDIPCTRGHCSHIFSQRSQAAILGGKVTSFFVRNTFSTKAR